MERKENARSREPDWHQVKTLLFCPAGEFSRKATLETNPAMSGRGLVAAASEKTSVATQVDAVSVNAKKGLLIGKREVPLTDGLSAGSLPTEIQLPHPSEPAATASFLVAGSSLYEMNSFTRHVGTASVLLQEVDCVLGSSALLLTTPVDPLFIFASLLHRHASSEFRPLNHILQQSAYSKEVQRNLQTLAMLPQVCGRLHLVSDVLHTQQKGESAAAPLKGEHDNSTQYTGHNNVQLHDCCRFSIAKTAKFVDKITSRATAALLQHQHEEKKKQQQSLFFKECLVAPGDRDAASFLPQQPHLYTVDIAEKTPNALRRKRNLTPNAPRQETNLSPAVAAVERLVKDYISGYLPNTLLVALKQ